MSANLKRVRRTLLVDELRILLGDLRGFASGRVEENGAIRSAELAKKVELTRGKLDDLRRLQRRERDVQQRRREIERENSKKA